MAEVKIPDMIVDYGNGAKVCFVYDEKRYVGVSKFDHKVFTDKIIELTGGRWNEKIANDYIKQLPVVSYFEAIAQIKACGKTLEEAVSFLAGEEGSGSSNSDTPTSDTPPKEEPADNGDEVPQPVDNTNNTDDNTTNNLAVDPNRSDELAINDSVNGSDGRSLYVSAKNDDGTIATDARYVRPDNIEY